MFYAIFSWFQVNTWLGRIGQATLSHHRDMGADHNAARDFLEIHDRLLSDIKVSQP